MSAPPAILDLIARFGQQLDTYKSGAYNETQLRRDFLDPLFKALGWDMDNEAGYAEAYRDVIHEDAAYCLGTDDRYLLGLLNSRLFWFVISNFSIPFGVRAGQYRYCLIYQYMEKVPIRVLDLSTAFDRAMRDRMVNLVAQMLSLHLQLALARTPHEQTALERQIAATDTQIDRLVYQLYGLTEDEIKIVEQG